MISNPRLKEYLTVVPENASSWIVCGSEGELWRLTLDNKRRELFSKLLPLLTGAYSRDKIIAHLATDLWGADIITDLLDRLESSALIEEADPNDLTETSATFRDQVLYFSRFSEKRNGSIFQQQLFNSSVDLLFTCQLSNSVLRQLIVSGIGEINILQEDNGIRADIIMPPAGNTRIKQVSINRSQPDLGLPAAPGSLLIAPLDAWDPHLLEMINQFALDQKVAWLPVQNRGPGDGIVGPLFVPGQTACYECLETRIRGNMALRAEYDTTQKYLRDRYESSRPWGGLFAVNEVLAGIATVEAVKYLSGFAPSKLVGCLCAVNAFNWTTEIHEVLRLPRCPVCRPPRVELFPWSEIPVEER